MNAVIQAFLPLLVRSRGAIVNALSVAALAPLPIMSSYREAEKLA
jgi:short-subunit dehydrogenase